MGWIYDVVKGVVKVGKGINYAVKAKKAAKAAGTTIKAGKGVLSAMRANKQNGQSKEGGQGFIKAFPAAQGIAGAIQKKRARAAMPTGPSSAERGALETNQRLLRQAETGGVASEVNAAQRTEQMMTSAMLKQGANPSQIAASVEYMRPMLQDIQSRSMERAGALSNALERQTNRIEDLKMDLRTKESADLAASGAANTSASQQNALTLIKALNKKKTTDEGLPASNVGMTKEKGNMMQSTLNMIRKPKVY